MKSAQARLRSARRRAATLARRACKATRAGRPHHAHTLAHAARKAASNAAELRARLGHATESKELLCTILFPILLLFPTFVL